VLVTVNDIVTLAERADVAPPSHVGSSSTAEAKGAHDLQAEAVQQAVPGVRDLATFQPDEEWLAEPGTELMR
jgi:hypothetical protein